MVILGIDALVLVAMSQWHVCPLYAGTPLSLQQLSRIVLRSKMGTRAQKVIGQLDICHLIRSYLLYEL